MVIHRIRGSKLNRTEAVAKKEQTTLDRDVELVTQTELLKLIYAELVKLNAK